MILLDTDVLIDVLRAPPPALAWLHRLDEAVIGLPGLVAVALIQGCRNRREQQRVEKEIEKYQCKPYAR